MPMPGPYGYVSEGLGLTSFFWSRDSSNAGAWTKTAATVSANAIASPDGSMSADKIIPTVSATSHRLSQTTSVISWRKLYKNVLRKGGWVQLYTDNRPPIRYTICQFQLIDGCYWQTLADQDYGHNKSSR